jgi:hypothetical protein
MTFDVWQPALYPFTDALYQRLWYAAAHASALVVQVVTSEAKPKTSANRTMYLCIATRPMLACELRTMSMLGRWLCAR